MRSLIQITVFLEILISCFLRSVAVCFIQWANQPGEPREIRILRCGVVRGIATLVEGMPIISSTGLTVSVRSRAQRQELRAGRRGALGGGSNVDRLGVGSQTSQER